MTAPWRRTGRKMRSILLWTVMLSAMVLVALLGWQNRELRGDRDWLLDRVNYAYPGMYVPLVDARTSDGTQIVLGRPEAERQVLFFFNHTCPYCLSSAPIVADAARALRVEFGDRIAMLGVCVCTETQAGEYARRHDFDFPIITMREERNLALYRARTVPLLMIIDREGRVRHTIPGVFNTREQVQQLMAVLRGKDASPAG